MCLKYCDVICCLLPRFEVESGAPSRLTQHRRECSRDCSETYTVQTPEPGELWRRGDGEGGGGEYDEDGCGGGGDQMVVMMLVKDDGL